MIKQISYRYACCKNKFKNEMEICKKGNKEISTICLYNKKRFVKTNYFKQGQK